MYDSKNQYINGSVAKRLEYEPNEAITKIKREKNIRAINIMKLKLFSFVTLILILSLVVLYRYSTITELNYCVDKYEKEYKQIKNENSIIKVRIENSTDLQTLRDIAENKLGMQKPDKCQIVYVKVPKNDFLLVNF